MSGKISSSRGYGSYYSNSSEAWNLDSLAAYELGRQAKEKSRIQRKKLHFKKKRVGRVYRDVGQDKAKLSPYSVLTIILVFLCALGLALSCAGLLNKQISMSNLNNELKTKREANLALESEISQQYDLQEIERIATTRLGMSKPSAYQVVHINVPKQSYVVQFGDTELNEGNTKLLSKIKNFIFG